LIEPLRHVTFQSGGADEFCLTAGPEISACKILILLPLFEEMNRMRRVVVRTMRHLAEHGIQSYLPDLPGCNESKAPLDTQDLVGWSHAVADICEAYHITHIASIRGGALIDHASPDLPHWRLAPANGASLARTMLRTKLASEKENGRVFTIDQLMAKAEKAPIELAGNRISGAMLTQLMDAKPAPLPHLRELALGEGENEIIGSTLWLRAEPQDDAEMARAMADDMRRWIG
jgi:hypothetical protein